MTSSRQSLIEKCTRLHQGKFNTPPKVVSFAPGRINLIGEHTDYHEGLAVPAAIEKGVAVSIGPGSERFSQVWSETLNEEFDFDPGDPMIQNSPNWHRYVRGIDRVFRNRFPSPLRWQAVITSDLPLGAGVSASAALELAFLHALAALNDQKWNPMEVVLAGQQVEHQFLGLASGLLDQLGSQFGQEDRFLWLDFQDLNPEYLPGLPPEWSLVVADTGTRRSLATGGNYQERVRQTSQALEILAATFPPEIDHLRDVTADHLPALENPVLKRRLRHLVTENERVEIAADCLRYERLDELGQVLDASHASLRDDYEVSWPEADQLVSLSRAHPACAGARMMGGGFGGVILALVETGEIPGFKKHLQERYYRQKKDVLQPFAIRPSEGPQLWYL